MRIAYVCADGGITLFGGKGAAVHISGMIGGFGRIGHEVRTLCLRKAEPQGAEATFRVERVAAEPTAAAGDRAAKERGWMAASSAVEARLLALYRDWPFDLIYERYALWSTAGVRAARRLGVPHVLEVNAPLVEEQAAFRQLALADAARTIERECFAGSDLVAVVSEPLRAYVLAHGARPERVAVIGNAVDTGVFHAAVTPRRPDAIPADAFVVGFSGSLRAWHGIEVLLQAFRHLKDRVPEAHLVIAGDGPRLPWVEGFAEGAGLTASVTLMGWVPHRDLPGLIAGWDVAAAPYPASNDHYFSPLKLYEYLALGRPVVASRIGQIAERLDGTGAALLVPPGDAGDLAAALERLAREPGLARDMAGAARAMRAEDWSDNARTVIALVGRLAEAAA